MQKSNLILIIFLSFLIQVKAEVRLDRFREMNKKNPIKLPKRQPFSGQMYSADGKLNLPFDLFMEFNSKKNEIILNVINKKTESRLKMDKELNTKREDLIIKNQELINDLGFYNRIGKKVTNEIMEFKFLSKNGDYQKSFKYSLNTMDSFTILPIIQQYLHYGLKDFSCDFVSQNNGLVVKLFFISSEAPA